VFIAGFSVTISHFDLVLERFARRQFGWWE
jgi:hypothetical protein